MTRNLPTLCLACARDNGDGTCSAFPRGIPDDIGVWGADHRTSRAGEPVFLLDPAKREAYEQFLIYAPGAEPAAPEGSNPQ